MAARKVLLLGILLLLPVLAFLFLYAFGSNTYKLRTYLPERVTPGRVGAPPVSAGGADTVFHRVSDTVLLRTGVAGLPFLPSRDLAEHIVVLALTEANPEATPAGRALLRQLSRVQERVRNQPQVKLLLVSLANSATLADVAERAGAIGGKWTFASVAQPGLDYLRRELRDTTSTAPANQLWLLDTRRYVRGVYGANDPRETERLAMEIGVLLEIERQAGNKPQP